MTRHPWGYLVPLHKKKKVIEIRRKNAVIYSSKQTLFCIEYRTHNGATAVMLHCFVGDVKVENLKILQGGEVISVKTKKGIEEYKFLKGENQNILMEETNLKSKYVVGEKLGNGAFGEVHAIYEKASGNTRALKIQRVHKWSSREADIVLTLQNPYVIQTYDIKEAPGTMYFVLEYMAGGDLSQYVTSRGVYLTEQQIKLIIYQVAKGVQYLHGNGICHRDLQPANILLRDRQPHTLVKVSDLGLAKSELMHSPLASAFGVKAYMAPEIRQDWTGQIYSKKVDIWSLGILLHVSLSGTYPAWKDGEIYLQRQLETCNAGQLLSGMLERKPHFRLSITEVIENLWLKDYAMIQSALKLLKEDTSSKCKNIAGTISIRAKTSKNSQREHTSSNSDNSPTAAVRTHPTESVQKRPVVLVSPLHKAQAGASSSASDDAFSRLNDKLILPSSTNSPAIVARRACETGTVQKTMTVAKSVLSPTSKQSEENICKYDTHGSVFSSEDHNNDNRHDIKRRTPSIRQEVAPQYRNTFNHYQPYNNNWHYYNQPPLNIIYGKPKESWENFLCRIIEYCFYIFLLFISIVILLAFFYAKNAPPPPPKKSWWH